MDGCGLEGWIIVNGWIRRMNGWINILTGWLSK